MYYMYMYYMRYNRIITERSLDINYRSFIVESFGAFASDTWKFINTVCDPNTHPKANDEYNPWNNPDPSRAFVLATGFANQRGNAVMLLLWCLYGPYIMHVATSDLGTPRFGMHTVHDLI